jgi:hypothetical protein
MGLLPLDEVQRRLRITGQSYTGVREVESGRIVGSVDWSADFGDQAASYAAREGVVRRDRRVIESEAAKPLHHRTEGSP